MDSAAPSPLRAPLQQSSQSGISRLIFQPAAPSNSNSRRPLTAPNSPRLGGAGACGGGGVRRKSASGARSRDADPSVALQKALSSDEFLRKREGKKRGAEGAGSENTQVLRNASSTSSTVAMSRSRSSSSATSSTASGSTLQPRHITPHPRASRSHSSLSSRQRSHSRSRASRGSPILAGPLPTLPPNNRSVSSSSCPEPRGATLSVTPTTSNPIVVGVQAEGELELRGRTGGNAAEVLVELRDGRSVPNSEYGDGDVGSETFAEVDSTLIQDRTLPLSLTDLSPTDDISHSHSLPSMHSSPHSQSHSRRPSASRHRTSPSAIPSPADNASKVVSNTSSIVPRVYSHNSAMSTSPRAASSEQLLSTSATRLPSAPASPSTRPRAPTTNLQQRGRSSTTSPSVSEHQRTPSQSSRSLVVEKRRRRESVEPVGGEINTPEHIRPPLHTYTSFETAFGVEAPRSPEGSPTKIESKGWWGRS